MKNALACALGLSLASASARADVTLKVATLAPEGSSWMKIFHQWKASIEERTGGRVKVKFYSGGVQGDEHDMLRKMRLGQLHGAAITAIGLGGIAPEVRALEVARTDEELDYARGALGKAIEHKFEDKGFVLLGWGDVGPVRIFSNRPLRTLADLQAMKLWLWSDDPITRDLFTALDVHGVPLGVPQVLPALSTGAVDAFFSSPLATLALQWAPRVRYVTSVVVGQATGATVLTRAAWDQIAPADRAAVLEVSRAIEPQLIAQVRKDNAQALATMQARGLEVVQTPPELVQELAKRSEPVAAAATARFSPEFQAEVRKALEQYRARARR